MPETVYHSNSCKKIQPSTMQLDIWTFTPVKHLEVKATEMSNKVIIAAQSLSISHITVSIVITAV